MANIGATTAFYKVETSLTRANNEVSKSMERLATGKANANAGDRSSYVAMSDTFRLDYVGTKAGIKGASVAMGYLETGMRTLDAASSLLSRLQELAVLGSNRTNTVQDHEAINLEAEAIADEFHRLMSTSTYKGKDIFTNVAASERVALGGRAAEMSFGIGKISYTGLYNTTATAVSYTGGPNDGTSFNLVAKPSDAVYAKPVAVGNGANDLKKDKTYEITALAAGFDSTDKGQLVTDSTLGAASDVVVGAVFTITAANGSQQYDAANDDLTVREINPGLLTKKIEDVQALVNKARVQAGSQYAALESAVAYTTDLTAQYELGFNTVNDVNFSMETAHLAKNQILQQAATAMLAQANSGQQGLLQLLQ
jgi:flagellin